MNMSDLTNCIQVLILDSKQVSKEHVLKALSNLAKHYQREEIPIMLYPDSYADDHEMSYDKKYIFGILDLDYINSYLQFMQSLTTPRQKKVRPITVSSNGA